MKLITFSSNEERNLIVQFPVFIQPYIQQQLILYQIETVPVPILDLNKQVHSYTHLQVDRSYIALNFETYISLRHQELRAYKNIGYEFYCEELFVVKHKSNTVVKVQYILIKAMKSLKKIVPLHITLTRPTSNLQYLMGGMKLFWQTGPAISTLNLIYIMIFQSKYPASLMF